MKTFTYEQVKCHNCKDDCWIIIDNKVYDVTRWLSSHPGGDLPLLYLGGRDATHVFKAYHAPGMEKRLPPFLVGEISEPKLKTELTKDFEKLRDELEENGACKSDYWFYYKQSAYLALLFSLIVYTVIFTESLALQLLAAVGLGLFWQQVAFIGHDAGHRSVSHSVKYNSYIGLVVGNMLTGVSIGWWRRNHNAHHIVTNSVELDPDIQHLPVLAITDKFFNSLRSVYYNRVMCFDKVSQVFVRYQHFLYYIIMGVARYYLYLNSFLLLFSKEKVRHRALEFLTLGIFYSWLFLLCSYIQTTEGRVAFIFLSHFCVGIIHVQITLNHFSMPTYFGHPQDSFDEDQFLISQLKTTMDIDCSEWMDFFHGGLQFQATHHLFPRLARQNLREVQGKVKALCKKHGVQYRTKTFFEANMEVIQVLKETAEKSKQFSPLIWDSVAAIG